MKTVASRLVAGLTAFALPAIAAITWGSISTAQAAPPNDYNGTATATVNGVTVATDYKIEQVATRGYATAQPNQVVLDSGSNYVNLRVNAENNVGADRLLYTISTSNTTPGYQPVITLRQFWRVATPNPIGNNEASTWKLTWDGSGVAKYSDPADPRPALYRYNVVPPDFDVNNREIAGLATTGEIANGGSFNTYQVQNQATEWSMTFPVGAQNITFDKNALAGGVCQPKKAEERPDSAPELPLWHDVNCGIDAIYPNYGRLWPFNPGETAGEYFSIAVDFVPMPAKLSVQKALDGARGQDTDQFTTQIKAGEASGEVVGETTSATSTGRGATIDSDTGTTRYTGEAGKPYFLTEDWAGSAKAERYDAQISCENKAEVTQPELPTGQALGSGLVLTPVPGADIACTITNKYLPPPPPTESTPPTTTPTTSTEKPPLAVTGAEISIPLLAATGIIGLAVVALSRRRLPAEG